jgi:hypothetical protein
LLTHNLQGLRIKAHWGKYGQYCSCLEVSEAFFLFFYAMKELIVMERKAPERVEGKGTIAASTT